MKAYSYDKGYEIYEEQDDYNRYAEQLISWAEKEGEVLHPSKKQVSHALESNMMDSIPPQIYALMGNVISAVEKAMKEEE